MLRRTLLVGAAALVLFRANAAWPQDDKGLETKLQHQARSLPGIRGTILAATGYDETSIELRPGRHLIVVTVVNSKLVSGGGAARVDEATVIASAVTQAIAADPAFDDVDALRVDYVRRDKQAKGTQTADAIEFRKDLHGKFKHHVS
jgi:hypothetical protein